MLTLGAQVLIGFQYQAVFQKQFESLPRVSQYLDIGGLVLLLMTLALYLFLSRTFYGRAVMGVSQDQVALRLMGANPVRIKTIAFGIGIAAAGLAGALLITISPVVPFCRFAGRLPVSSVECTMS